MLLNSQRGRNRVRLVAYTAVGLLVLLGLWSITGPVTSSDTGTGIVATMSSWPAAILAPDGKGADSEDKPPPAPAPPPPPPAVDYTPPAKDANAPAKVVEASDAPYFFLIGDSTTCGQRKNGGGWGDAFLWRLTRGAEGVNMGVNGALSTGYYHSGIWTSAMEDVKRYSAARRVYVTIQFGHNDQNPAANVTLDQYQEALVGMGREVLAAGGTPILVTPLARRDFDPDGTTVTDNLRDQRERTIAAHQILLTDGQPTTANQHARLVNLNEASMAYIGAIGKTAAFRYNKYHPFGADTTHLNELGATVFGRIVADLMLGHPPTMTPSGQQDPWAPGGDNDDDGLSGWIGPDPHLSGLIWHGDAV